MFKIKWTIMYRRQKSNLRINNKRAEETVWALKKQAAISNKCQNQIHLGFQKQLHSKIQIPTSIKILLRSITRFQIMKALTCTRMESLRWNWEHRETILLNTHMITNTIILKKLERNYTRQESINNRVIFRKRGLLSMRNSNKRCKIEGSNHKLS